MGGVKGNGWETDRVVCEGNGFRCVDGLEAPAYGLPLSAPKGLDGGCPATGNGLVEKARPFCCVENGLTPVGAGCSWFV